MTIVLLFHYLKRELTMEFEEIEGRTVLSELTRTDLMG